MKSMFKKIGIIGFGNMGFAIAERIKAKYAVFVFDKDKGKTRNLKNISVIESSAKLVANSEVIILSVKPQDFNSLLNEIKNSVKDKLLISIAAGITTGYIEKAVGEAKVIRVMPNIGAKIGEAESSLCKGRFAALSDLESAQKLFNEIGKTWIMPEDMIDAVTAISGSGPAYIFYDMEINNIDPANISSDKQEEYVRLLKEAAETVGFDTNTAMTLATATTASSIHLASIGIAPAELKRQVTSKGGTTEAALNVLTQGGSWADAALAAKKRARELSK